MKKQNLQSNNENPVNFPLNFWNVKNVFLISTYQASEHLLCGVTVFVSKMLDSASRVANFKTLLYQKQDWYLV